MMIKNNIAMNNKNRNWERAGRNYYGGRIYKNDNGWKAIEVFNYYYQAIGFNVLDKDGKYLGDLNESDMKVRTK